MNGSLQNDASVRLAAHRETVSVSLLQRTSGQKEPRQCVPWTIVGVGSVGSKIALHSARAGLAPSVVVDPAFLSTHNFARHAALPSGKVDRLFAKYKADIAKEQMAALSQNAKPVTEDAVALSTSEEGLKKLAPDGTKLLVNASACLVAREALSHANWSERPRLLETCLLGSGDLAYFAAEGEHGNPSLSDLAAEAYRIIAADEQLAETVFSAEGEHVAIGQGCSALTFPMSDAQISLASASFARKLTPYFEDDSPGNAGNAELSIAQILADGSLIWSKHDCTAWVEVPGSNVCPSVRIHPRVHAAIEQEVAAHKAVETGGVLIGRYSAIGDVFQIVDLIDAPSDSTRSAEEFVLGTKGLAEAARAVASKTSGALQVLGTWHSHLHPSGPSQTDAVAGAMIAIRQFQPALLLIHTPAGYGALVAEEGYTPGEDA